ncbi:hypothetical protein CERZMDRAFT_88084 [Cercospora zeae-maydis SCOH1-5]|uniref:Uncharacterized protein n=1 Tax=Cercospora zeae-maydis SCOH1-5 TaxID=717836 RepID=A0A6A6F0J8_9PEZI|nr:hypothetical protein CERZMDRAFT_88084 [Cercospora zeae-maydis SCOH1-5]
MTIPPHLRSQAAQASAASGQTVNNKPPSAPSKPPSHNAINEDIPPKRQCPGVTAMDPKESFSDVSCRVVQRGFRGRMYRPKTLVYSSRRTHRTLRHDCFRVLQNWQNWQRRAAKRRRQRGTFPDYKAQLLRDNDCGHGLPVPARPSWTHDNHAILRASTTPETAPTLFELPLGQAAT